MLKIESLSFYGNMANSGFKLLFVDLFSDVL